jgi:signal peptide peptidase SppA
MSLSNVMQTVLGTSWAMEPEFHRRMMGVLHRWETGAKIDEAAIEAAIGRKPDAERSGYEVVDHVARIPIRGVIAHRASQVGRISTNIGASVEHVRKDLRAALADDDVDQILLDVDSPGGSVTGLTELAADIRAARDVKPITARTDSMMASAAYWLASQANRIVATPSAMVGSIGVIASFWDSHRAAANAGYDPVTVRSVPGKGMGQRNGSVGDADLSKIQREVDAYHSMFVADVAAGRGITLEQAQALGDGHIHLGREALEKGLIDAIASPEQVFEELAAEAASTRRAQVVPPPVVAAADPVVHMEPEKKDTRAAGEVQAPAASHNPAPAVDLVAAERNRVSRILANAHKTQGDLAAKLIADGTPLVDALEKLNLDAHAQMRQPLAVEASAVAPANLGNSGAVAPKDTQRKAKASDSLPDGEEKWAAEFAEDAKLRAEFGGDFKLYAGWKRNERLLAKNANLTEKFETISLD